MMNISASILDIARSVYAPLKRWKNRNNCIKRGQKIKIQYGAEVASTSFEDNAFIAHHASCIDSTIGNYTSIGRYTKVRAADIGRYCSISWDVTIGAVAHPLTTISSCALTYKAEYHLINEDKEYPQKRVTIGNDVWIGCNSTIVSGVKIGNGAVIGAGAVVTKDVEPYTIVTGVPATVLRKRFNDGIIERIEKIAWWDWNQTDLKCNLELFSENLSEEVVSKLENYQKTYISKL